LSLIWCFVTIWLYDKAPYLRRGRDFESMRQTPAPGTSLLTHSGDTIVFKLDVDQERKGHAVLRTSLGGAAIRRREIIESMNESRAPLARDWSDIPMLKTSPGVYEVRVPLIQVGTFRAKAFFIPEGSSRAEWPDGGDVKIKTAPAWTCCGSSIYTVFPRQFGKACNLEFSENENELVLELDEKGWAAIPPGGTFRDVIKKLDTILGEERFRIVQLLPIHPVPTTFARMGRFGSPFAGTDFMNVDPALAEFDKTATPLDQFCEFVEAVHSRGARVFMDIPANHTGWASTLQIHHPDWFVRDKEGNFVSPGAWGVVWEDLVELDYSKPGLRNFMAEVFEFWCSQGVDGFRCDAGYMVPAEVWRYILARVRTRYPDTVFLLEGLGGKISVTRSLIEDEGLDWAYSEIFQTEDRSAFERYMPGALETSLVAGPLVNFAETHDNNRLASRSNAYSRMRVALCALISGQGCFGITNGVEWFAAEKVDVHGASGLRWGDNDNQVNLIGRLNAILEVCPAFASGAKISMIQTGGGNSLAILRETPPGYSCGKVLVLVNLSDSFEQPVSWAADAFLSDTLHVCDLLSGSVQTLPPPDAGICTLNLAPAQVYCFTTELKLSEKVDAVANSLQLFTPERVELQELRSHVLRIHAVLKSGKSVKLDEDIYAMACLLAENPLDLIKSFLPADSMPPVTVCEVSGSVERVVMLPPGHFTLLRAESPFRCVLELENGRAVSCLRSCKSSDGHYFAVFSPVEHKGKRSIGAKIVLDMYELGYSSRRVTIQLLLLPQFSRNNLMVRRVFSREEVLRSDFVGLLTNGRGAMTHIRAKWGEIRSQYDAILAANPHPDVPCDRQMLFTRCRAWIINRGFSIEVNSVSLKFFEYLPESHVLKWVFCIPVGTGRNVDLTFLLTMHQDENRITLVVERKLKDKEFDLLDNMEPVQLVLRPDIESRNFHTKTKAFSGLEADWSQRVESLSDGFKFKPSALPGLSIKISAGDYIHEPEWHYMVEHSMDAERGQDGSSDLFSPGWFSATLEGGTRIELDAECICDGVSNPEKMAGAGEDLISQVSYPVTVREALSTALRDFVVRRDDLMTVIAGYPWFLDWGRDTFIVLRGMIADGMTEEALGIIRKFGEFEKMGTIPNMISGDDASNIDTSDAPLWYIVVADELSQKIGHDKVFGADCKGRTVRDVILSIVEGYVHGTPNGIRMDEESGLVYSPSHFTWMDTNYPAGTPRTGYPVEIQALWISALKLANKLYKSGRWIKLCARAEESFMKYFWLMDESHLSDCLHADTFMPASQAVADDHLRCNQLFAVTLGALRDMDKCRGVLTATERLLVPGAIRSLDSSGEVKFHLPVYRDGRLLNDPARPYWGRYEGDEDTRRKPAYHNGTAWTWPYPSFAESLILVYGKSAENTARALIGVAADLLETGCIGHLPEIMDGDAPHKERGCDAQAWGVSEFLRVALLLDM
jgi:starch synthase (maltosyl-transferring)